MYKSGKRTVTALCAALLLVIGIIIGMIIGILIGKRTDNDRQTVPALESASQSLTEAVDASGDVQETNWKALYAQTLRENMNNDAVTLQSASFSLINLNGDSVPELVIATGDFHASGAMLFTVSDGEVVKCGEYGCFGSFLYIPRKGIIESTFGNSGAATTDIYTFDGKNVNLLLSQSSAEAYDPQTDCSTFTYTCDGITISEAQFNENYKKYIPNANALVRSDADAFRYTETEIRSALS